MARIIGIDYGAKRTGLAWTDPMQLIATGIEGVETKVLETKLRTICAAEAVEAFVVGYPTQAEGEDTDATPLVRDFAKELEKWFPEIEIHFWEEAFTSQQAIQAMVRGGVKKKRRRDKHLINEVSAVLILQDFMENR